MREIVAPENAETAPSMARAGLLLGGGAALMFVAAGGMLWWREGEKLFTDGLVAAIMRCF
jgi:hypothetical protein